DMCGCAFGLTYDATITHPTGAQYRDTGNSGMTLIKTAPEASFMEAMVSSLLTPFPICVEDADGDNGPACDNDGDGQKAASGRVGGRRTEPPEAKEEVR